MLRELAKRSAFQFIGDAPRCGDFSRRRHRPLTHVPHLFLHHLMPEPNRSPWQVHQDIAQLYGWQILESGLTLVVECDACARVVEWPPRFVARYFANLKRVRMPEIASRLRCGKCRSNWVKVSGKR
ncbi:MAG: hypothetical protein SGI91_14260 [Alphaproteobacteria bacterium]|nr:hypothetical protein [Alphaproteobacteria bacterium]